MKAARKPTMRGKVPMAVVAPSAAADKVFKIQQCFAEDWGYDHKERELCEALFVVAKHKAGGYGASGARQAGQDGQRLCDADNERVERGYVLFLTWFGDVGECQQPSGKHEAAAHNKQRISKQGFGIGGVEDGFDFVFQEESDDGDGYH